MSAFTLAFTEHAIADGVVFKFDTMDAEHRQAVIGALREKMRGLCLAYDEETFTRLFRVKIFNMDRNRGRAIVKVSVYGVLAPYCYLLPAGYLAYVHEAHFKAYVVQKGDNADDMMRDGLYKSEGIGQQLTLFSERPTASPVKGSGKGWRIGDRKSDYNFVGYRRTGQKMGIEVRIQDRPVRRLAADALELATVRGLNDREAWLWAMDKVAGAGADRLEKDLNSKGVDITAYMHGFTRSASECESETYMTSITTARAVDVRWEEGIAVDAQWGEVVFEVKKK